MVQCAKKKTFILGKRNPQEALFYYFNMADMILRLTNKYVDFSFIHSKVKHFYSDMGRPSIDSEVFIRMFLIGYLYGITSERKLCEEVRMHIGYRWFVGLDLHMNDEVPDHSTFSKNRHGRFKESGIFQKIFDKRNKWKFKIKPQTLVADKGYATGEFVCHVFKEGVTPHIPIIAFFRGAIFAYSYSTKH